ncbi:FxsA family protein [soil metagenome]
MAVRVWPVPLPLLFLIFLVVPFAELYLIFEVVGDALGAPLTILLLAADSVLGAVLLRAQGRTVWRQMNEALAAGRMPHRELQNGVAIVFGGAFLMTPGFLTDILGVLLLLPPTRSAIVRLVAARLARRLTARLATAETRPRHDYDVEGTATEQAPPGPERLER